MVTSSPAWHGRGSGSQGARVLDRELCLAFVFFTPLCRLNRVPLKFLQPVRWHEKGFGIRFAFMISSLSGLSLGRVEGSACFWEWGQHLCPSTARCVAQSWKVLLGSHQLTAHSCPLSLSPIIYLSHHHLSTNPFSHLKTWMQRLNNVPPNQNHY